MLEVLYNDSFTQLSLVNNLNNESFAIIDDDFKVYETISYNPFEPTNEDILMFWKEATKTYFGIGKSDDFKLWKSNQRKRSINAFHKWLEKNCDHDLVGGLNR